MKKGFLGGVLFGTTVGAILGAQGERIEYNCFCRGCGHRFMLIDKGD